MNIIDQIRKGESKVLELKEKLPKNESIAKTIVAFSNTSGGKLIIGIKDNHQIKGIEEDNIFKLQDKISSIIYDNCYPNILPEIYTVNIEDKLILVIEVFRGNLLPYYLKKDGKNNGTFIRIEATNRKAEFENILELERQKRHVSYDEEINYETNLAVLDLAPIKNRFNAQNKKLDITKLKNLKLVKEENDKLYPTNALLIALGYFENCMIKCARFKGTTMEVFLDKKEYSTDLFSMLENTLSFIQNHINLRGEIKGLCRIDTYELPTEALREALINALIHRDYTNLGRDIKVAIYDDTVEIVSPGGLPVNITMEDIHSGRSETRNRVLANLFKELGLIEKCGSGIKRMKALCFSQNLKEPIFTEKNDFFAIEFSRLKTKTTNVGVNVGVNELYKFIEQNQPVNIQLIVENFKKVTKRTIERWLKNLREEKKIEFRGPPKTGGYYSK